jgi:hypothetical protein
MPGGSSTPTVVRVGYGAEKIDEYCSFIAAKSDNVER